jgi:N-acetylmuramoyl-L-alanine amidase
MALRWLIALLVLLLPHAAIATAVAGVLRVMPTPEGFTLRLALSEPLAAPPRAFALADPMRWAIDLGGASSVRRDVPAGGGAKAARVSQFDAGTVRIVVDLVRPMQLVSASQDGSQVLELTFRPTDADSFRRQIARGRSPVAGFSQAVPPAAAAPTLAADSAARMDAVERALAEAGQQVAAPAPASGSAPVAPAVQPQQPLDTRTAATAGPELQTATAKARLVRRGRAVVVIDPGHGGHDPGAPAAGRGNEKEVTLAIAKAAKAAIETRARERGVPVQVKLTRDTDVFIPLGGRVRLARQWGADLFISIHADSAPNIEARGASVYTLSDVASDREAARLAAKENRADLIAGVDLRGENREVANLLIDLGMRDSMNASADFAQALQRGMEPKGVRFRSQFHRFAGFQVLRNLGVPAVLLETGYLSNAEDADYLFSRRGQQAVADGIGNAVVDYLDRR